MKCEKVALMEVPRMMAEAKGRKTSRVNWVMENSARDFSRRSDSIKCPRSGIDFDASRGKMRRTNKFTVGNHILKKSLFKSKWKKGSNTRGHPSNTSRRGFFTIVMKSWAVRYLLQVIGWCSIQVIALFKRFRMCRFFLWK